MSSKQTRLVARVNRVSPIRPGEPREPLFDSARNVLTWKGPADDTMVTHYRIRQNYETGTPLFQVPVGQRSVQVGPGLSRVFITAYNAISDLESGHVEFDFQTTPGAPFSDLSMLYELPQMARERGPFHRTIDIKDTTVGNNIADATTVDGIPVASSARAVHVIGVLRAAITSDLVVRLNVWVGGVSAVVGTFTIPLATAVNTPLTFTTFTTAVLPYLAVLTWDITASDGSKDASGVASFSVWWK